MRATVEWNNWRAFNEDSMITTEVLNILRSATLEWRVTISIEDGVDRMTVPLIYNDKTKTLAGLHWFFPYLKSEWFSTSPRLWELLEQEATKMGYRLDILDIKGIAPNGKGTRQVILDLAETVDETIDRISSSSTRRRLRKALAQYDDYYRRRPTAYEIKDILDYWDYYWSGENVNRVRPVTYDMFFSGKLREGYLVQGLYRNDGMVGSVFLQDLGDGELHSSWVPWYKKELERELDFGYLAKIMQIKIGIDRGSQFINFGSSFGTEWKEKFGSRIVRADAIGIGLE